ncbi:MAG: integration host factor subunit alpha [Deltaproteobacteria bacterium]|nr:integration host factor subunit alpha [Deltaproteobacteria bacterium]
MTFTKAHMIDRLNERIDIPRKRCAELIESMFEILKNTLEGSEDVLISGFGKFCVKHKRERMGRNPETGESLLLPARKVVTFSYSWALREKMNEEK